MIIAHKTRLIAHRTMMISRKTMVIKLYRATVRCMSTSIRPRLENKTAVVTGASSGIGKESTRLLVENGAKVIGIDIDKSKLSELQSEFGCDIIEGDVSKEDDVKSYSKQIKDKYSSIDILINNAGIAHYFGPLFEITNKEFEYLMNVNVMGVFWNCKYLIPSMLNKKSDSQMNKGSIINISSIAGLRPFAGIGPYVVTKHAVDGLTKQVGLEYISSGIRCNSVHPGWCKTPIIDQITSVCKEKINVEGDELIKKIEEQIPTKRFAQVSEIAPIILFLASDESVWCNASSYVVDAGQIICGL